MKKILLILILLLLSGCTVEYDLLIKNNGEIEESISLNFPNEIVDANVNIKEMFDNRIVFYKSVSDYTNYFFDYSINNKESHFKSNSKFENIINLKQSKFLTDVFKGILISKEKNITTIIINKYDYFSVYTNHSESTNYDVSKDEKAIEKVTIAITLEKEVVNSNADRFDNESNTYYWELNPYIIEKEIQIAYNQKTRYDIVFKNIIKNNLFTFIGYSILVSIVLIIFFNFVFKSKNNSKI
jgi:hypothetical protein